MSQEDSANTTAVAEAESTQATQTEASPAEPGKSDASRDHRSETSKQEMEAWNRFQRIAAQHEKQDKLGADEASPAEEAKGETAQETDEPASEAEESGESDDKQQPEPPEGFDEAVAALVRDGVSEARIQKWFQDDPDDFIKTGLKRAKSQKDVDRLISGQPKTAKGEQAKAEPEDGKDAKAEPTPPPKDYIDATKRAIDSVLEGLEKDELHADLKEPLGVLATQLAEQMGSYLGTELAKRDAIIEQIQKLHEERVEAQRVSQVETELKATRDKLTSKYPSLKDDEAYRAVLDRYDVIVAGLSTHPNPSLKSVEDVFTEAAKWHFSDENPAHAVDRIKKNLFKRSAQQKRGLSRPKAQPANEKQLTVDQIAWQRFNKIADKHEGATAA